MSPYDNLTMTKSELNKLVALENANVIELIKIINAIIGDGSPKGVFPTLFALKAKYPNGAMGIYLVTANGHWYYYNQGEWKDGGVYQATGIADGSIGYPMLDQFLQDKLNEIDELTASDIGYSGVVPTADDVKQAVDYTYNRLQYIIQNAGDSNIEVVDARGGFPLLDDRLNNSDLILSEKATSYTLGAELLPNTLAKLNTDKPITIAGVGDSIMDGYYATGNNGYMEILTAALSNKFGVTVTLNNQGISGYTVRDSLVYGKVDIIDNTSADLFIISFGHNDIKSGLNSTYIPGYGYPQNQSIADMEYIIRRLITNHPNTDIIVLGETPYYTTSVESNVALVKYTKEMQLLAVKYSCLFVDLAPLFEKYPNYDTALMYDAGHPNEAGHRLISSELMKYFIEATVQNPRSLKAPTSSLNRQWRYANKGWKKINEVETGDRFKFYGAGWASGVTTTAGNFVDIAAKCNCIAIEVEMTVNTRLLLVRDSINWFNDYTFTNVYPSSPEKFWLTIPFDGSSVVNENVGLHSARLYLRSGSLKIHQVWASEASQGFIPCDSTTLTLSSGITVTANANTSQLNTYYSKYLVPDSLEGYAITIPFVGTGLGMDCQIQATTSIFSVVLDGVAQPDIAVGIIGSSGMQGGRLLCSGLPFGQHTITLTAKVGNVSKTYIGGFTVLDETNLEHPRNQYGMAKVGEVKTFGVAYDSTPFVIANGNGVYPTIPTKNGFTLSGTTNEIGMWKSEGSRVVY